MDGQDFRTRFENLISRPVFHRLKKITSWSILIESFPIWQLYKLSPIKKINLNLARRWQKLEGGIIYVRNMLILYNASFWSNINSFTVKIMAHSINLFQRHLLYSLSLSPSKTTCTFGKRDLQVYVYNNECRTLTPQIKSLP